MAKNTEIANIASEELLADLRNNFPQEQGFSSVQLPRISFKSQDVFEGKGKAAHVVTEAGTFFTERESDEVDDNGKKVWTKDEMGKEFEGIVVFRRKQLRMYDEATEKYTSSPVYDTDEDVMPLWSDKVEVARGTAKELQAKYMGVDRNGKPKSKLEENILLYVLMDGELFQLNLRGSSMYSFKTYARKTLVPAVLTRFSSEEKENGSVAWNQMSFVAVRPITQEEGEQAKTERDNLAYAIASQKAAFADRDTASAAPAPHPLDGEFDVKDLPFGSDDKS